MFELRAQAFDRVISDPQVAKCLACTVGASGEILTVEEAVATYMDSQIRRAAAKSAREGDEITDTKDWEVRLKQTRC